jgi:tetratricopeptide (TPR) repeat protein
MTAIAGQRNNKIGLHAAGMAFLAIGRFDKAADSFKLAVDTPDSPDAPNPVLERSLTWYADVLIELARATPAKDSADAAKKIQAAKDGLDQALKVNPGYLPIQAIRAKLALYEGDPEAASKLIEPVMRELGIQYPAAQLVWAEVLATRQAADKDKAQHILETIKDRIQPASMVGRVAALIDPKLPDTLGVPAPAGKGAATPVAPVPPAGTRRRGR